jgi:hypothetical protein
VEVANGRVFITSGNRVTEESPAAFKKAVNARDQTAVEKLSTRTSPGPWPKAGF